MRLLGLALILVGSSAFAATGAYDLKMNLSLNGKHVSSPRVIVKVGETAEIHQKTDAEAEETFIEVIATEDKSRSDSGIMMKFIVGYIGKNGERRIISRPQILAQENEPAQITIGEDDQLEKVSLSVLATRKTL